MNQYNAEYYRLMGGFQVALKKEENQNEKAYLKVIPASKIPVRDYLPRGTQTITQFWPYWVVRTLNNTWKLREQQILKLGRLHMKVKEIKIQ